MNTFETIKARKSVRAFEDKPVEKEKIEKIANAGNMAAGTPMAGKVYFNVISNKELLKGIAEATKAVMQKSGVDMLVKLSANPMFNPLYNAPVAIVVSTDIADNPNSASMATQNAACAAENMLLAATDLGLGSCYLMTPTMAFAVPAMKEATGLKENTQPVCVVVVGYTNDTAPHREYQFNPDNITYVM